MTWDRYVTVSLNSDSTGSFYTGDIVTGNVLLEFDKTKKIGSVDLEVIGISKAQWTRSAPTMPYIKIYSEKKKVFYTKINNIFENITNDGKIRAGVYSYPFHFALPFDLPSTFKSSVASVDYTLTVTSKSPCRINKTVTLNILGHLNINSITDMLDPCFYDFKRTFQRSNAEVLVTIETFRGIGVRQILPLNITVTNKSKILITKLKATLIQKLHYTVSSGYLDDERKVTKKECRNKSDSDIEMCNIKMEIPQLNPSSIYMSDPMIDISYEIRIEVVFPFHRNLQESIPITIASVPVLNHDV